ncbi:hypothetical protein [Rhizobium leguminosarum]|uniref:hypothetical protein n=1 Tax=Rhizobium leguminosarum TaxID=384 RepID=UPI0021BC1DA3|nr:hypothetical protein [Rhizobium leguminosarum]
MFVDRDALKLAKLGQIAVHDIDTLRSKPDTLECYHERRKGYSVINVVIDRDINPVGCLYTVLLQSVGIKGPSAGLQQHIAPGTFPASDATLKWRQHMPFANADLSSIKKISLRNA